MRNAAPALENNLDWGHKSESNKEQLRSLVRSLVGYKTVTPGSTALCLYSRECHWREKTPQITAGQPILPGCKRPV